MTSRKIVWLGLFPPENPSVGDHAQALAIQKWFKDCFPTLKVTRFYRRTPPPEGLKDWNRLCATVEEDDLIFIHSSGDWGTLFFWTGMTNRSWHDFRRRLVNQFPDNMIVQLPVSVFYHNTEGGKAVLAKDKALYKDKSNLVLMCREPVSHQILADNLECKSLFVPDFVFYLKPQLTRAPRRGVLLILRKDHETTFSNEGRQKIRRLIGTVTPNVVDRDVQWLSQPITDANRHSIVHGTFNYFQQFRVIVTDRLHAMIFSAITETPCVALDDKIPHKSSGYEGVVSDSIKFVKNIEEIPSAIRDVISRPFQTVDLTEHFTSLKERMF